MHPRSIRISVDPAFYILLAAFLLMLPLQWVLAVLLAATFHELCHMLAMRCFGVRISALRLGLRGACIRSEPMEPVQELICAAAGPAGGMLLLLLAKWMPMVAVCGAFQTLFNLLPIFPLDGGRVLRSFLRALLPMGYVQRTEQVVTTVVIVGAFALAVYAAFVMRLGVVPLGIAWILLLHAKKNLQS